MAKTNTGGTATLEAHDTERLQKQVSDLSNALAKLYNAEEFKELILLLRRPGWTTPAELIFATGIVDSMLAHTKAFVQLKGDLMRGSEAVRSH
jgi:hypothetical protein